MDSAFWAGLKQRKLVQWGLAYIAAAFALIQVLDVVAQRFGWPDRIEKIIILVLAIGFFVALVLAWYHGERGAQKVGGAELLIIALLLAIGGGALWAYARMPRAAVKPAVAGAPKPSTPETAAATASIPSPASIPEKSVAVLPFANESGQADQRYFSDGLSEDLITALSQFNGLKVISRDSAFQFRNSKDTSAQIGKLLGVAHLLEGSVQRAGDEVRITATLVNASDGAVLWTQRYDKPYKDLFALQDAITKAVSGALKARLLLAPGAVLQSDRPPSGNLAAFAAFQHGRAYGALDTEAATRKAIAAYIEAIRLDPRYAAAYAHLSAAWVTLAIQYAPADTAQAIAHARKASATALKLDSDLADAHAAHSYLLLNIDQNWHDAESEAERALQLAPHDPGIQTELAGVASTLGHNQRAADLQREALVTNPRSAVGYYGLAQYLSALGQQDAARQTIEHAIALQPKGTFMHEVLAVIDILRGDAEAALSAAQQEPPGPWHDVAMALALQVGTDHAAADAALAKLIKDHAGDSAYQIAQVYALRGDANNTFKWLDRAWSNRDPGISSLLSDPLILRYRNDPRFAAFCRKVGLPTTTDAVAMK